MSAADSCGGMRADGCRRFGAEHRKDSLVSGDAAKKILTKREISADTVAKITQACVD